MAFMGYSLKFLSDWQKHNAFAFPVRRNVLIQMTCFPNVSFPVHTLHSFGIRSLCFGCKQKHVLFVFGVLAVLLECWLSKVDSGVTSTKTRSLSSGDFGEPVEVA
jgi:hypothetical protein